MKETEVELSSYPVDDKASASVNDGATSEPAQEQPKARPQRLASFKDYLVCFSK
jgi:ATP-binding cassette subfamily B (MDR/TAP) protein 1